MRLVQSLLLHSCCLQAHWVCLWLEKPWSTWRAWTPPILFSWLSIASSKRQGQILTHFFFFLRFLGRSLSVGTGVILFASSSSSWQIWRYFQVQVDGRLVRGSDKSWHDQVGAGSRWQTIRDWVSQVLQGCFRRRHGTQHGRGAVEEHPQVRRQWSSYRASQEPSLCRRGSGPWVLWFLGNQTDCQCPRRNQECEWQ